MNFDIYIITPSFNAGETIVETIESIISQNTQFNIRYHIQDGLSTDSTCAILRSYEEKLRNSERIAFSWISQKDRGMYDAVNTAVNMLSIPANALMGWINADDILARGCLERLRQVSETLPQVQWMGGRATIADMQWKHIHLTRTP